MGKARPLTLELLEDRITPTAFSAPWPEPEGLTLSFAPDGTSIGGQPSSLFQTLDARLPASVWQQTIIRAFQTWAVEADVNVALVADGGQPFGTLGLKEGDPRFGDIRIGAQPMASDVLAVANPYDPFVANTWVGDIVLNSNASFGIGTQGNTYDLFSVLLHEAGHVFGLDHSTDPNSPMYAQFTQVHTGLTPADTAALQAIYGPRQPDAFEGPGGNDTLATATVLDLGGGRPAAAEVEADITTHQDVDMYRVRVPQGVASLGVNLTAAGESLLVPRLTVYDANGNTVASALAADPLNNNLSLQLDHVLPGDTYYVKVEGGTADVFGMGKYQLAINPSSTAPAALPGTTGYYQPPPTSLGGIQLLATTPGYVEHTYYETLDKLSPASPVQTYRVRSADLGPDLTNVMTVVVASEGDPNARFAVNILDDQGNPVDGITITESAGHLEVRVPNVLSNRDYFVQVRRGNPEEVRQTRYEFVADFAQDSTHLQTFVNQSLDANTLDYAVTLQVVQSQQFHFMLSATDWSAPVETGIRMTIYNAGGQAVFTTAVADGATRSADVFLDQGSYTVRFTRANAQGNALQPVLFELSGITTSEPLGPRLRDTTLSPADSAAAPVTPGLTFFWLPYTPADLAAVGQASLPLTVQAQGTAPAGGPQAVLAVQQVTPLSTSVSAPGVTAAGPGPVEGNALPTLPLVSSIFFPLTLVAGPPETAEQDNDYADLDDTDLQPGMEAAPVIQLAGSSSTEQRLQISPLQSPQAPVVVETSQQGAEATEMGVCDELETLDNLPSSTGAVVQRVGSNPSGLPLWAVSLGGLMLTGLLFPARALRFVSPALSWVTSRSARRLRRSAITENSPTEIVH